ncbi:MAG: hypothetical protein K9M11_01630 [Candidatus Pacebacteria bacterium]|nr:hypothetical protein [Candidatus Paceibacterota bacterium]
MSQKNDKELVPEPPSVQIVIPSVDLKKMERWIAFFNGLSERVYLIRPRDDAFGQFYRNAAEKLRVEKMLEDDYKILDWPKPEEIAFVVMINIAPPGSMFSDFNIGNSYFFCFGKRAFSVTHFVWDGDAEQCDWAKSYSLSSYTEAALSWPHILDIITGRIRELEDQVPDPPAAE